MSEIFIPSSEEPTIPPTHGLEDQFRPQYDAFLDRMQTPQNRAAVDRAFRAHPGEYQEIVRGTPMIEDIGNIGLKSTSTREDIKSDLKSVNSIRRFGRYFLSLYNNFLNKAK